MKSLLPKLRPSQKIKKITSFIKKTFKAQKHQKAIIASSGGIDSSLCLALTAKALGPKEVIVLSMPYNKTAPKSVLNSQQITKFLKIPKRNHFVANIGLSVERVWKNILINLSKSQTGQSKITNQIRLGNIMARTRMIYMFDMAKARQALVVGTENFSEHFLGYYTRFGDQASDLEPLKHLYKSQVFELAQYLKFPTDIIDQAPSAGLWPEQTDKEELGFSYYAADNVYYLKFVKKMTPVKIAKKLHQFTQKKSKTYWRRVTSKVLKHIQINKFKSQLPYSL